MAHNHRWIVPSPPAEPLGRCWCRETRLMSNVIGDEPGKGDWHRWEGDATKRRSRQKGLDTILDARRTV